MRDYRDGPYHDLIICVNKDPSAWTAVWNGTCRSSKRFWFPEVRDLGRFCNFLRFWARLVISITRQRSQTTVMDHIATLVDVSTRVLALGLRFAQVVIAQGRPLWLPRVVLDRFSRFLRFWARLVMYITRQVCVTTKMKHIFPFSYVQTRILALGPRFGLVLVAQVKGIK